MRRREDKKVSRRSLRVEGLEMGLLTLLSPGRWSAGLAGGRWWVG